MDQFRSGGATLTGMNFAGSLGEAFEQGTFVGGPKEGRSGVTRLRFWQFDAQIPHLRIGYRPEGTRKFSIQAVALGACSRQPGPTWRDLTP